MKKTVFAILISASTSAIFAQQAVTSQFVPGAFPIVVAKKATPVYVDANDHWLVRKAAALLQTDIEKVTGIKPDTARALIQSPKNIIVIGSLDQSPLIQQLVATYKLSADSLKGKWEAFQIQVIQQPWPGVDKALVIAGSDRRGTAYGVFELSKQLGVSPWYWWADVPIKTSKECWYKSSIKKYQSPGVTYRGIFLNDEAPALSGWSKATFGGFNHLFYEKVFELLLRLKANYLWPAMWGSAFYDDDTLNPVVADQYGIVIGTSHHEPMLRAHDEWRRYGNGKWNYDSNEVQLKKFWSTGIRRKRSYESIVTVGMRGDGDKPMSEKSNIEMLEKIVADQRQIITQVTGKDATATPQLWALYKEVQDYYDNGMRVPDDITLLFCDDNWGNIRKLPKRSAPVRAGGYGIYYHFDYVGGPRNYKWINTNTIARTWEQMHLAYEYGVNRIWIVNVGDLKPMELPISFFLDYAWDPAAYTRDRTHEYTRTWASQQFGQTSMDGIIAYFLLKYTQYNSRRKPELLAPDTYSLINYQEAEKVVKDYNDLVTMAETISSSLPAEYRDAFYQLVLFPIKASANLNELYVTAGKNYLYAKQGRVSTNDLAARVQELFIADSLLSHQYNHVLANGKWNHMMDQTHIGYTYWQQPPVNKMPTVKTVTPDLHAQMGIAVEGSEKVWPEDTSLRIPSFNIHHAEKHYIDLFNRGKTSFTYTIRAGMPWMKLNASGKPILTEERIWIDVDWAKVPYGKYNVPIIITGPDNKDITFYTTVTKLKLPVLAPKTYVEGDGYISMEASRYSKVVNETNARWDSIHDIGRTADGVTIMPPFTRSLPLKKTSAHLEYNLYTTDTGSTKVMVYCSPTLPFNESTGLQYAVSFDDQTPQLINLHADNSERAWAQSVSDNIRISTSVLHLSKAGQHTLKIWAVDPGVVLQKIVIDWGGVRKSYLGPPAQLAD